MQTTTVKIDDLKVIRDLMSHYRKLNGLTRTEEKIFKDLCLMIAR